MRIPAALKAAAVVAAFAAVMLTVPAAADAQSLRPLGTVTIQQIIGRVINGLLGILGSISLLMFVWGGITWMTAAGNDEKIKKAKNTIVYAVFGLIMAFLSYTIVFNLMYQVLFPQVQNPDGGGAGAPAANAPATNGG